MYKFTDKELDTIIADWKDEWKISVSSDDLSNTKVGTPANTPVGQA